MSKVIFGIIIIIVNFVFIKVIDKYIGKFNLYKVLDFRWLSDVIKGFIYLLLLLLNCPAYCIILTSGFVMYDYFIINDFKTLFMIFLFNLASIIYISIAKIDY